MSQFNIYLFLFKLKIVAIRKVTVLGWWQWERFDQRFGPNLRGTPPPPHRFASEVWSSGENHFRGLNVSHLILVNVGGKKQKRVGRYEKMTIAT